MAAESLAAFRLAWMCAALLGAGQIACSSTKSCTDVLMCASTQAEADQKNAESSCNNWAVCVGHDGGADSPVDASEVGADAAPAEVGGDQTAEEPAVEGVLPLNGSIDLRFDHVDIDVGNPYSGLNAPLSKDLEARLDLRNESGVWQGVFTPRWAQPSSVPVQVSQDRVVLGAVVIGPIICAATPLSEVWDEMVIARGANGLLATSLSATGRGPHYEMGSVGQMVGAQTSMAGEASLQLDQRAPSVKLEADGVLPWSAIKVSLDEGAADTQVTTRLKVTAEDGAASTQVQTNWTGGETDPKTAWAGSSAFRGAIVDWDAASGHTVHVTAAAGIEDLAGNPSMQQDMSFQVLSAGATVAVHDFGVDSSTGTKWGSTSILTGPDAALCEGPSCLLLGPILVQFSDDAGFAGRIVTTGQHNVRIRYRVLTDGTPQQVPSFIDATVALKGAGVVA